MADDLQAGTCGGGRSVAFDMAAAVPCSTMIADAGGGIGFSWMASVLVHGTARSCEESSAFGSSITFQDSTHKFQHADVGPPLNADSSLQLPVFGIGTPSMDWTQDFVSSARAETSLHAMLQEDLSSFFGQHQSIGSNQVGMGIKSSTMNLEDTNQKFLSYYHQLSYGNESGDVDVSSYSFLPTSYGCPPSTSMLQGLFEAETKLQQPVYINNCFTDYKSPRMDYRGRAKTNSNGARESYSSSSKGPSTELALKRLRTETPLPLPTFKVRKEKLGDRITALQQLVSPFGKTDTASVLHEAIEYIKFLHDQVGVLSTPYLKSVDPMQHQQASDKSDDGDGIKQELRSRGLCLVPIASTYPVASETAAGRTLR